MDTNKKDVGYVWVPYEIKTIKTTVNNRTVWHSNKIINLFLKINNKLNKIK